MDAQAFFNAPNPLAYDQHPKNIQATGRDDSSHDNSRASRSGQQKKRPRHQAGANAFQWKAPAQGGEAGNANQGQTAQSLLQDLQLTLSRTGCL
ncbi:MAG: hypothetical protein EBW55_04520 [Betaproteobacteria bacterium]|nr:hypothetical protein [Betaproteobacteria bacterium]